MQAIITGTGHFVPDKRLTNKDLEKIVDTNDEWIVTRTGIKERRILDKDRGTSYMAIKAVQMILEQRNISADEIDLIIVATSTPDMLIPSTAAFVQKELNASNCWGFDLNAVCSGFVYALATASQFIETGKHKKVIVIGADKVSSIVDYKDRNTCVLFGDGAGAVLLEPSDDEELGIKDFILHLDGSGAEYLRISGGGSVAPASHDTVDKRMHYIYQDGRRVFKHAVIQMANVAEEIIKKNNLVGKDIKLLIPHQANLRIIAAAAKRMELNSDQVFINVEKYGNTTAGTIPIALSEAHRAERLRKGDWVVFTTFGAGFTWGSLLLKWAI